MVLAELGQ